MDLTTILAMGGQAEGGGNPIVGFIPIVLVMGIFYMLILRPQQRRQKEHQKMVTELGRGDKVLTNGGLYATIQDVKDEYFSLRMQKSTGDIENPLRLRTLRRDVARIRTIMKERGVA